MLIRDELLYTLCHSKHRIEELIVCLDENNHEAFYMYSFSIFESSLLYINRTILISFPQKINRKFDLNEAKNDLIKYPYHESNTKLIVNAYLKKLPKGSLYDLLLEVNNNCGLKLNIINEKDIINEMNKLRNDLIHEYYMYKEKNKSVSESIEKIKLYMYTLIRFIDELTNKLGEKYKKYTKKAFVKRFWNRIFNTPLLPFDKCVCFREVFTEKEQILFNAEYLEYIVDNLSSSEKFFLALIIQQFSPSLNDRFFNFASIPMLISIDENNKDKIYYILDVFKEHPYLFNGMKMTDVYLV